MRGALRYFTSALLIAVVPLAVVLCRCAMSMAAVSAVPAKHACCKAADGPSSKPDPRRPPDSHKECPRCHAEAPPVTTAKAADFSPPLVASPLALAWFPLPAVSLPRHPREAVLIAEPFARTTLLRLHCALTV
jgi:hypothetical protein